MPAPRQPRAFARYLGRGEDVVLVTRQHPFVLLGRAASTAGLVAPLLLASWGLAGVELLRGNVGDWILRVAFVLMALLVVRLGWHVVEWEFERVVVTDEKVIHVEGVLHRRIASTPLAKVSEFTVLQPWLGRIFDYGSLVVDVPGGREQALHGLAYLPDPTGLYRLVSDTAREGRLREGGAEPEAAGSRDEQQVRDAERAQQQAAAPMRWMDPWAGTLTGEEADHTIRIPKAPGA